MPKRPPKRPDIQGARDKLLEQYEQKKVRPYLQYLLDQAQRKLTRHKLKFVSGMGTSFFTIDDKIHHNLTEAVQDMALDSRRTTNRWQEAALNHFPELIEFTVIEYELDEHLNYDIGDMEPTKETK
jgi:hypothetical protein